MNGEEVVDLFGGLRVLDTSISWAYWLDPHGASSKIARLTPACRTKVNVKEHVIIIRELYRSA